MERALERMRLSSAKFWYDTNQIMHRCTRQSGCFFWGFFKQSISVSNAHGLHCLFKEEIMKLMNQEREQSRRWELLHRPYQMWAVRKALCSHMWANRYSASAHAQLREANHLTWKLSFHLFGGNHSEEVTRQLINNKGDSSAVALSGGKIFTSRTLWTIPSHFLHVILARSEISGMHWIWIYTICISSFYHLVFFVKVCTT